MREIVVRMDELPMSVVVVGGKGQCEQYNMTPAKGKVGAALQKAVIPKTADSLKHRR